MFCKFCGSPVDRKTMKCTACDKPVGILYGGNSFRYVLEKETSPADSDPVVLDDIDELITQLAHNTESEAVEVQKVDPVVSKAEEKLPVKQVVQKVRTGILAGEFDISSVLSAFCALLSLAILVLLLVLNTKGRSDELYKLINGKFNETAQMLEDIEAGIEGKNESGNRLTDTPPVRDFSLDKNPSDELAVMPDSTKIVFVCNATGENLHFSWMKYDSGDNRWFEINEKDNSFEIASSPGGCSLKVVSASAEHEGSYICRIVDGFGATHYSAPVVLSLDYQNIDNYGDQDSENTNAAA